eukprot:scaffold431_cov334-Pavlova_lutheri.AAC.70
MWFKSCSAAVDSEAKSKIRSPYSWSSRPASVSRKGRLPLRLGAAAVSAGELGPMVSNSGHPTAASRAFTARVAVGWDVPSALAPRTNPPQRTTAHSAASCCRVNGGTSGASPHLGAWEASACLETLLEAFGDVLERTEDARMRHERRIAARRDEKYVLFHV